MAFYGILSIGFCPKAKADFCSQQLPSLGDSFNNAIAALEPWLPHPAEANREIASLLPPSLPNDTEAPLSKRDKAAWQDWAQKKLVVLEQYIDELDATSRLRPASSELAKAADQLVAVHGFASVGSARKMVSTLERVREHYDRAHQIACTPEK